jgi:hypothetical protein
VYRTDPDGDVGRDDRRVVPLNNEQFEPVVKPVFKHLVLKYGTTKGHALKANKKQAQDQRNVSIHLFDYP